jgi:hypothetical protein
MDPLPIVFCWKGGKESCGGRRRVGPANLAGKFSPWEVLSGGSARVLLGFFFQKRFHPKKIDGIFFFL